MWITGAQAVFRGLSIVHAFLRVISDLHLNLLQNASNSGRTAPMNLLNQALEQIKPGCKFPEFQTANVCEPVFQNRSLSDAFAQNIQQDDVWCTIILAPQMCAAHRAVRALRTGPPQHPCCACEGGGRTRPEGQYGRTIAAPA